MRSTAAGRPDSDSHACADRPLTYENYLRVPDLLRLQQPLSAAPDELHFIVVHQAMELWFKLLADDLRAVVRLLDEGRLTECCTRLRRVNDTMAVLLAQLRTLRSLPPAGFHAFRGMLDGASGLQSEQFRELELLSGLRDEHHLRTVRAAHGGTLPATSTETLLGRSVADAHLDAGRRDGLTNWVELYLPPRAGGTLYVLSELLLDYDELWLRWRTEHVTLVRRMIGTARGTGGTGVSYLERTLVHRFFPHLWDARDHLPGAVDSAHPAGHPSRTPAGGCPAFYEGGHNA
jgi:tryptophan 2,3-dioxygenase